MNDVEKIGHLAIKADWLVQETKLADFSFSAAVSECIDWHASDADKTVWKIVWTGGRYLYQDGKDASADPLAIAHERAYLERREARKRAGIAKANVTRAIRRLKKD